MAAAAKERAEEKGKERVKNLFSTPIANGVQTAANTKKVNASTSIQTAENDGGKTKGKKLISFADKLAKAQRQSKGFNKVHTEAQRNKERDRSTKETVE